MTYTQKHFSRGNRPAFVRPHVQPSRRRQRMPTPEKPITSRRSWRKKMKQALRDLAAIVKRSCAYINATDNPVELVPANARRHERAVNLANKIVRLRSMDYANPW